MVNTFSGLDNGRHDRFPLLVDQQLDGSFLTFLAHCCAIQDFTENQGSTAYKHHTVMGIGSTGGEKGGNPMVMDNGVGGRMIQFCVDLPQTTFWFYINIKINSSVIKDSLY